MKVTGFLFPAPGLLPSHIVGLISLVMLALATFAYYGRHLSGIWRPIYTITAVLSLYLNVFVVIIPSFLKIPPLKSWAPTQTEPAFLVVLGSVLVLFIVLAISRLCEKSRERRKRRIVFSIVAFGPRLPERLHPLDGTLRPRGSFWP